MQLDGMALRHQANVAGNRRRFLHRDPAGLQFGHDVQGFAAAADRTRRAGTKRGPTIAIIPCTHFVWPGNFTAAPWGSWAKTYHSATLRLPQKKPLDIFLYGYMLKACREQLLPLMRSTPWASRAGGTS